MEIPFEKIADNSFFAKFSFSDVEYKTILYLEDDDWGKPILLGCDSFKKLVKGSSGAELKLIKQLMEVKDAGNAFIIIKEFIHQFDEELERYAGKKELKLLEEIRAIGFDKILDTNDEFTRFKLKISNENVTITLKILKNCLEYSLDLFEDFPIKKVHDTKKGYLGRVMKSALNDYKDIERLSIEIFLRLDEQFLTLRPERFDKQILKRRIQNGNDEEIIIYYEFESKELILKTNSQEIKYKEFKFESLFLDLNSIINAISTEEENYTKDCGICYSNFLDGNLTDFKCLNTKNCNQAYHVSCLREWFRVNPESRTVFDQICGRCLFCDEELFINNF